MPVSANSFTHPSGLPAADRTPSGHVDCESAVAAHAAGDAARPAWDLSGLMHSMAPVLSSQDMMMILDAFAGPIRNDEGLTGQSFASVVESGYETLPIADSRIKRGKALCRRLRALPPMEVQQLRDVCVEFWGVDDDSEWDDDEDEQGHDENGE